MLVPRTCGKPHPLAATGKNLVQAVRFVVCLASGIASIRRQSVAYGPRPFTPRLRIDFGIPAATRRNEAGDAFAVRLAPLEAK